MSACFTTTSNMLTAGLRGLQGLIIAASVTAAMVAAPMANAEPAIQGMHPDIKIMRVKVSQQRVNEFDMQADAMIEAARASSPVAVNYAERAKGVLVFPDVRETGGFLVGEMNAMGVLYTRDAAGELQKDGYYHAVRHRLGTETGKDHRSVAIMFMTPASLETFQGGDIGQSIQTVDVDTGRIIAGNTDDEIAAFVFNAGNEIMGVSPDRVLVERLEIIE